MASSPSSSSCSPAATVQQQKKAALILQWKREALEYKTQNQVDKAKQSMAKARMLEALDVEHSAADLQKLAVLLKQQGDVEGAKHVLLQSKRIAVEQQRTAANQQSSASTTSESGTEAPPSLQQQELAKKYTDPVNQAIDEASLDELYSGSGSSSRNPATTKSITFTDDEMLDVETMVDMQKMDMPIPSRQEYQNRADACKRAALQAKQGGDLATAKAHLVKFKQFTQAMETLFCTGDNLEGTNANNDDGEDYSLLEELMGNTSSSNKDDDGFFEQLFGMSSTMIELDDLDDLDPSMLRDMMDNGMEVPNVEDVLKSAQEKKTMAVQLKQQGNLPAAKAMLEEAKRLESRAQQLATMLQKAMESDGNQDPEALLEAMLENAESSTPATVAAAKAPGTAAPTKAQQPLMSSNEYKVRAVQCKQGGQMAEALENLRLYKQALANEQSAQAAEQRKAYVTCCREEASLAVQQCRLFLYYEWFVDEDTGRTQRAAWKAYARQCTDAAERMESMSSESPETNASPKLQRNMNGCEMKKVCEPDLSFIGRVADPTDERIEVSILECRDLASNKHLRKVVGVSKDTIIETLPACNSIRVVATSQLPANMEYPDDPVDLFFLPKYLDDHAENYVFTGSQFLHAERGKSRLAKLIYRRLTRKRITVDVVYVRTIKKSGLFSKAESEEHLLGTAVVELKDLLETNWIAGDFPLLDLTRRHQLGGSVRLAIRSGGAFTDESKVKSLTVADDEPISADTGLISKAVKLQSFVPLQFKSNEHNSAA